MTPNPKQSELRPLILRPFSAPAILIEPGYMINDKDKQAADAADEKNPPSQETLHLKNPFKPGEEVDISPEELDKEQEYKEALTERD